MESSSEGHSQAEIFFYFYLKVKNNKISTLQIALACQMFDLMCLAMSDSGHSDIKLAALSKVITYLDSVLDDYD